MIEFLKVAILAAVFCLGSRYIYPPLIAALFIFGCPYDTAGTAAVVPLHLKVFVWPVFIAATWKAFRKLFRDQNTSGERKWAWNFGCLAAGALGLIELSRMINCPAELASIENAERLMAIIVALAYVSEPQAQLLFFATLAVQVLLALGLTLSPEGPLRRFIPSSETTEHLTEILISSDETAGSRFGAQFTNTIGVGFYGAIAFATGIFGGIFGGTHRWLRVASLVMIPVGGYLLIVSTTRGITIGLLLGLSIYLIRARGLIKFTLLILATAMAGNVLLTSLESGITMDWAGPFAARFDELRGYGLQQSEAHRLDGIKATWIAVKEQPLFGFGSYSHAIEKQGNMAHVAPLSDMSIFGIPFAVITTLFLFCAVASDIFGLGGAAVKSANPWANPQGLSGIFGWVVVATALTNGYAVSAFMSIMTVVAMAPFLKWLGRYRIPVKKQIKETEQPNASKHHHLHVSPPRPR